MGKEKKKNKKNRKSQHNDGNSREFPKSGVDMSRFYRSSEWDVTGAYATKYVKYYPCCKEGYPDIKFNITMQRKMLFFTLQKWTSLH